MKEQLSALSAWENFAGRVTSRSRRCNNFVFSPLLAKIFSCKDSLIHFMEPLVDVNWLSWWREGCIFSLLFKCLYVYIYIHLYLFIFFPNSPLWCIGSNLWSILAPVMFRLCEKEIQVFPKKLGWHQRTSMQPESIQLVKMWRVILMRCFVCIHIWFPIVSDV